MIAWRFSKTSSLFDKPLPGHQEGSPSFICLRERSSVLFGNNVSTSVHAAKQKTTACKTDCRLYFLSRSQHWLGFHVELL